MDTPPPSPSPSTPEGIPPNDPPRGFYRGRFGPGGPGGPSRFVRKLLFFGSLGLNVVFLILIVLGAIHNHRMMAGNRGYRDGPGGPMRHHHGDSEQGSDEGMRMADMEKMMMFMMLTKEMEHMQGPEGHPPMMAMPGMPGMGGPGMPPPPMGMPQEGGANPPPFGPRGGREGHNPKEMLQMMLSNRLQLTDDEKTKLKQLVDDEAKDLKTKLRAMLTPDQQKELDGLPNF